VLHHADLEKIAMQPCINQRSDMPSFGTLPKAVFLLKYSLQTLKGLGHKIEFKFLTKMASSWSYKKTLLACEVKNEPLRSCRLCHFQGG
jgi:hypothetical protein